MLPLDSSPHPLPFPSSAIQMLTPPPIIAHSSPSPTPGSHSPRDVLEFADLCSKHNVLDLYLWLSFRFPKVPAPPSPRPLPHPLSPTLTHSHPQYFVERDLCLEQKAYAVGLIEQSLDTSLLQQKFSLSEEYRTVRKVRCLALFLFIYISTPLPSYTHLHHCLSFLSSPPALASVAAAPAPEPLGRPAPALVRRRGALGHARGPGQGTPPLSPSSLLLSPWSASTQPSGTICPLARRALVRLTLPPPSLVACACRCPGRPSRCFRTRSPRRTRARRRRQTGGGQLPDAKKASKTRSF